MSISKMGTNGLIDVPTKSGGVNLALLNRIKQLEQTVSELSRKLDAALNLRADNETYGLVRLSDSESVTDGVGLALSAIQNNQAIEGTIRNRLEKITNGLNIKMINREVQFNNGKAFVQTEDSIVGRLCITQICGGNGANYSVHMSYPAGDGRIFITLTDSVTALLSVCILCATK